MRIATVAKDLDSMIGYLHACRPQGRLALVYDLMEPLRPRVDRPVLSFLRSRAFAPCDFILSTSGVRQLHPQLARQIKGLAMTEVATQDTLEIFTNELQAN